MNPSFFRSNFFSAIIDCIYLTDATVKLAIQLVFILEDFTDLYALCTIIYLLYWIINHFQIRSTGRVSDGLHLFHGTIFGLLGVICVVELSLYIGYTVTTYEWISKWGVPWHWVQCTRRLAFFVVSLEIVIRAFCLVVRTSRNDRQAKVYRFPENMLYRSSSNLFFTIASRAFLFPCELRLFRHELVVGDYHYSVGYHRISRLHQNTSAMDILLPDHLPISLHGGHISRDAVELQTASQSRGLRL